MRLLSIMTIASIGIPAHRRKSHQKQRERSGEQRREKESQPFPHETAAQLGRGKRASSSSSSRNNNSPSQVTEGASGGYWFHQRGSTCAPSSATTVHAARTLAQCPMQSIALIFFFFHFAVFARSERNSDKRGTQRVPHNMEKTKKKKKREWGMHENKKETLAVAKAGRRN